MILISGRVVVLSAILFYVVSAMSAKSRNCSVKYSAKFGGMFADCRGIRLQLVPRLNSSLVGLDLSNNNITLHGKDFNYSALIYLNLSNNGLTHLPNNVFISCQNLILLDVGVNSLAYNNVSFPQHIFKPLSKLKILNLGCNDNSGSGEYPDAIFQHLVNLEELIIDTFDEARFGVGFGLLKRLRVLNLSGQFAYCNIKTLHNDKLSVFKTSNVSTLDMSYCETLTTIQTNALAPLRHLSNLSLEHSTSLGLLGCLSALQILQGTNMTSLNFANVDTSWKTKDDKLFEEKMSYVENICVSELNLAENHLMSINITHMWNKHNRLSKCLKRLDIHGNFIYGYGDEIRTYEKAMALLFLNNIEYLDISGFVCYHKAGKRKTSRSSSVGKTHDGSISRPKHHKVVKFLEREGIIIYQFPQNLKTVLIDAVISDLILIRELVFFSTTVLETMSMCEYDTVILTGIVKGFDRLKTLKIAHNNNMTLSVSFFDTFPALENLYLNDVVLPRDYFYLHGRRLFSKLKNLKFLDLSDDGIRQLPEGIFTENPELQTLILSRNEFSNIPLDIRNCPNLLQLKLDENKISFLDESTTFSFDEHARERGIILDLSNNKFACLCESVYFLFWLQQNSYIHNKDTYYCTPEDAKPIRINDIDAERVWQRCAGKLWLAIAVPLFVLILLVSVSTFLIVKHKTQVIYFFQNIIRKYVVFPKRKDFQFDVCLCYAEQDWRFACLDLAPCLEKRYGYTVYLHDRNSVPGDLLANSIMYGISISWKTILLLTDDFVADGWSWFTMHVAISAVTSRTPYRLIILTDNGHACEIPDCILCVVDEDSIITTPDTRVDTSWDDLVRRIQ